MSNEEQDTEATLIDWYALDNEHKKFVLRVRDGNGGKHAAEPSSIDSTERCKPPNEEYFESIALWKKLTERLIAPNFTKETKCTT